MSDAPRYLHRRSEFGYTGMVSKALPGVGEAVSVEYQAELSVRAELREAEAARDVLEASRVRHVRSIDHHLAQVRYHERELRRINQGLRRLDGRL